MAGYYDKNKDYSKELQRTDLSSSERAQLTQERQNKINDVYGGKEPNMTGSNKTYSQTYGNSGSSSTSKGTYNGIEYDRSSNGGGVYGAATSNSQQKNYTRGGVTYNAGADMSRRPDLAGGYAVSNGYTVFYDNNGYAYKATKGAADYTPFQDQYAANGYTNKLHTDEEMLTGSDQARIQALRQQAAAGQITWDQANQQANAIRSGYGYTVDKSGLVTDLPALAAVDARRAAWGLTDQAPSQDQVSLLQTLYPNGSSLLNQLYEQGYATGTSGQITAQPSTYTNSLDAFAQSDASQYLKDMYAQQIASQLAALKSTYEQNVADVDANDDLISDTYARQKNQAAAQNDLTRMQMAEMGITQGLNTGTTGQMALAQSAAYQGNLAELGGKEAQSLAENALNREKLTAAYRNAIDEAQASGNAELASALYNEYVRQENMAWQKQQAAQEQANWEATFNANQQQYQNSLSNQDREYAYNLASSMLSNGVMPDSATLSAAGISTADAQNLARYYQSQAALEAEYTRAQIAAKNRTGTQSSGSASPSRTPEEKSSGGSESSTNSDRTEGLSEFAQLVMKNMKDSVAKNGSLTSAQKSTLMSYAAGHQLTNDELNAILDAVT